MIRNWLFNAFLICSMGCFVEASAQTLPVGSEVLEDYYRGMQLLGAVDSSVSFMVRPLSALTLSKGMRQDSSDFFHLSSIKTLKSNTFTIRALPVKWKQQYNTKLPYGWNDGLMVPARGYQTMLSGGLFIQYKALSIQLQPEAVYAENKDFEGFPTEYPDNFWWSYYNLYNYTDLPERFGSKAYHKVSWGQSSIRLKFGGMSLGISNENLWWGPGVRSSLLMSNTAPGFKHITLNTLRPLKTAIGSFEGQLVAGKLEGSGFTPPEPWRTYKDTVLYKPKRADWRYLSAFVITYQPKWVPGLFLGATRSFQIYHKDMGSSFTYYFPLLQAYGKQKTNEGSIPRDQLSSIFARWLWKEANAEIYFEYGRGDHSVNIRDVLLEPEHSRAYIAGLRKLIALRKKDSYLQINLELTQLQQTINHLVREAGPWYLHYDVRHGYTNKGQVLGAGIGPGSNLQSFDISWKNKLNRIGLQLERYLHNQEFYYFSFQDTRTYKKWVDISPSAFMNWSYKRILFNARVQGIKSYSYQWKPKELENQDIYVDNRYKVFNLKAELGLSFGF